MPQAGSAWIPVTPDLRGFHKAVDRELQGMAPQFARAGAEAGKSFTDAFRRGLGNPFGPGDPLSPRDPGTKGAKAGGAFADGFRRAVTAALKALPDIKLGADATPAERRIQEIRAELAELSGKRIGIDISDAEGVAKVRALQAELAAIGRDSPSVRIKVDTAAASAELAKFAAEEKKVSSSLLQRISKAGFLQPSGLGTALALIPAAIPLAAGLTAGVGLLGISFAGAAAGAGLFGLLAKSALTGAATAATAVTTAQTAYAVSLTGIRQQYAANMAMAKTHAQRVAALTTEQKALTTASITQMKAEHAAYAQMTPQQVALSKAVGGLQAAWRGVQQSTAPLIAGALLPWIRSAESLLADIRPAVAPVAAIFRSWGQTIQQYFASGAGIDKLHRLADDLGNFSAGQIYLVGQFIFDIGKGIFSLGRDLAAGHANFSSAGIWLYNMGQGFASWSASKRARDDVQGFLRWMHTEGPVVTGVLRDLGHILPGIFAGASTAGSLELKAIGALLSLIAKLPQGWQSGLTEAAGAILLLSKTGVLKVGFTVAGNAAGWVRRLLGGASVDVGAAGMQTAGDTMLAAARAMQRAADTMLGRTAASEDAGALGTGAAAGSGTGRKLAAAGATAGLGVLATATIADPLLKGVSSGPGGRNWLDNPFGQGVATNPATGKTSGSATALTSWGTLGHDIMHDWDMTWNNTITRTAKGFHDLAGWFDKGRHDISRIQDLSDHYVTAAWNTTWNNTIARGQRGLHDVAHGLDIMRHGTAGTFNGIRHDVAAAWNATWNNTIGRLQRGIRDAASDFGSFRHRTAVIYDGMRHDIAADWNLIWSNTIGRIQRGIASAVSWFAGLPGRVGRALGGLGRDLENIGSSALAKMGTGIRDAWGAVYRWLTGLPGRILHALGIHSPPDWAISAGQHIMGGIMRGLHLGHGDVLSFVAGLGGKIGGMALSALGKIGGFFGHLFSGGSGGGPVAALAQQMAAARGWTGAQWQALNAVEMAEAAWNLGARNPTSGAYGIAQFINGPAEYAQYGGNAATAAGQVTGFLNYVAQRYRTPAAAWAHEQQYHWYDEGGWLAPGMQTVLNATRKPEAVLTSAQWQMLSESVRGGDGAAGDTYNLHFDGLTAGAIESHVRSGLAAAAVAQRRALRTGRRR